MLSCRNMKVCLEKVKFCLNISISGWYSLSIWLKKKTLTVFFLLNYIIFFCCRSQNQWWRQILILCFIEILYFSDFFKENLTKFSDCKIIGFFFSCYEYHNKSWVIFVRKRKPRAKLLLFYFWHSLNFLIGFKIHFYITFLLFYCINAIYSLLNCYFWISESVFIYKKRL